MANLVPRRSSPHTSPPKNVIVLVLDTVRGKETVPARKTLTPTIARLADTGTEYQNAFADAPWSLPSHASLFTGTKPSTHQTTGRKPRLNPELTTVADVFAAAGYETVGISNNTWVSEEFRFDSGFESFLHAWNIAKAPETDQGTLSKESQGDQKDTRAEKTTTWITDWMATRDDSRPYFLFANYIDAHLEYAPPEKYVTDELPAEYSYEEALQIPQDPRRHDIGETSISKDEFDVLRALYRGEITYLDANIEKIVNELQTSGDWDDTIFVITADHGENIGEHGFLGHQYNIYDTLLHIPLVITGGAFSARTATNRLIQLSDLAPTLLDEVGIKAPSTRSQFQGYSFHPGSNAPIREQIISEYSAPQPSLDDLEQRFGSLAAQISHYGRSLCAIRTHEYKFIHASDGSQELYEISDDQTESRDLIGQGLVIEDELATELRSQTAQKPPERDPFSSSISTESKERLRDLGYL
ncbi:sulfatase [Haladaptatus halobius]|uniref:sulfatase n=1 Tax=Haladaptatus halobius TaxID=2884875 RepID=UPI001D0AA68B|nr:sulfatase [Haladaptatus halobius]